MSNLGLEVKEFIRSIATVDHEFDNEFDRMLGKREIRSFHLYTINDRNIFSDIDSNFAILLEGKALVNHQGIDEEIDIIKPRIIKNPLEVVAKSTHVRFIYLVCGGDYLDEI